VKARRRLALVIGLCFSVVGCSSDRGGYIVMALNEWDRDVIVAVTTEPRESRRLPARTWGTLFISRSDPIGDLTVFDETCRQIASFPLGQSTHTVHLGPAGDAELIGGMAFDVPAGMVHAQRDGGDEDTLFRVERCP
jgi:hypothetical protein